MTQTQKSRIIYLRGNGESYAKIAAEINISENTVKSFCRRNNIEVKSVSKTQNCHECGKPLIQTEHKKKKKFCSDKCRMRWWNTHPESVNRRAVYKFVCPVCGANFESYGNASRRYCSRACFGLTRRRASDD